MPVAVENWAEQIRGGDVRAISRAITAIENNAPEAEEILRQLFPFTGSAYLVGITGAPGTGKSSLVDRLAAHYRQRKQTVGIIAVDPTSPFSGGAILGDRIRMQRHATDSGTYIRSMATRGFLGGLARTTADVARANVLRPGVGSSRHWREEFNHRCTRMNTDEKEPAGKGAGATATSCRGADGR